MGSESGVGQWQCLGPLTHFDGCEMFAISVTLVTFMALKPHTIKAETFWKTTYLMNSRGTSVIILWH
jgi:hypothetical protein